MRRLLYGSAAAALVVALAVVPAVPASAAAPVTPLPWLPSTLSQSTSTVTAPGGLILADKPPGMSEEEWHRIRTAERNYRGTLIDDARTKTYTPRTAPQPLSPAKAPTRGITGGPLGLVLMAPLLVNGGLEMIAISAEGQALGLDGSAEGIICSGIGATTGFAAWLYGEHNCGYVIQEPNLDVPEGFFLTYGGVNYTSKSFDATNSLSGGMHGVCVLGSAAFVGVTLEALNDLGAWVSVNSGFKTIAYDGGPNTTPRYPCGQAAGYGQAYTTNNPRFYTGAYRIMSGTTVVQTAAEAPPDPTRTPRCRVGWDDGSETFGDGAEYTELAGLPLGGSRLGCEEAYAQRPSPGTMPNWVKIESEDEGGAITEIATMPVPSEANQPKPSEGLKLMRVVGTELRSCMTWEVDCADWWEESDEGTNTEKYRCTFGGETVSLAECGVYRHTFEDPGDVKIGDPLEQHEYSWGTGADPYAPPTPGTPVPTGGGACSPSWSWNPVDWVLNPLKCAFIPGTAAVTATQTRVVDAWDDTMIGKLPGVVAPLLVVPDLGSGCQGPHVLVPLDLNGADATIDWYPFQACEAPGSTIAAYARNIGAVILVFMTALGIIRRISSVVRAPGIGSEAGSSS